MNQQNGKPTFEEYKEISGATSWAIIIMYCLFILILGFIVYTVVPDTPRQWDFGILPDTPAESIYSSTRPALQVTPGLQIPPLPDITPLPTPGGEL